MFEYTSVAFREGKEIYRKTQALDNAALSCHGVEISRKGLLELLNRWNRNGLIGVPNGGPVYLYYAI